MNVLYLLGFVGLVVAAPAEKQDRAGLLLNANNCNFQNLANLCSVGTQTFHSVPSDNTKFIQCNNQGEMYVVQCPAGKHYDAIRNECIRTQQSYIPNGNPGVVGTGTGTGVIGGTSNPCTAANIATGHIYFVYQGDVHRFIECDPNGNPSVLSCPSLLTWDQGRQTCVYKFQVGKPQPTPATTAVLTGTGVTTNPCRGVLFNGQMQFYPHPDPHKFIQCNTAGDAYVLSCPTGLVWSDLSTTCTAQYQG